MTPYVLKPLEAMLLDPQLSMTIVPHHVQVPGCRQNRRMRLPTRHLLNKYVKAARFGNFETFDVLVALFKFLMIKSELPVGVVTPDEDLSEIEKDIRIRRKRVLLKGGGVFIY